LLGIIAIGGTVGGIFFARSRDDDDCRHPRNDTQPVNSVQSGNNDPTEQPPVTSSVIVDELKVWIAPTEQDMAAFDDPTSPQSQALEWLESDPIALSEDRSTKTVLQRYILAVLYFATSGPNWYWPYLSSDDVCTWNTWNTTYPTGVLCIEDHGIVDKIEFWMNNLTGTLPWELGLLTDLRSITMDANFISGTIPSRIGELHQLEYFWLCHTLVTGPIPSVFPPSIVWIDLSNNLLTGSIPTGWDILSPKLEYLYLSKNSLTGTIPSDLGNIVALHDFEFYGNSITGSVDQFFCQETQWSTLQADCEEVECSCCTGCCYDDVDACAYWQWYDP